MNSYEERRQERIRHYEELAEKAARQSEAAYERSNRLTEVIPFGQPILVGHHSEGAHRAQLRKIHRAMDQSVALREKASYYAERASAAESNNMISSDDPDAIRKLQEKLAGLEEQREKIKEKNKELRAQGKEKLPAFMLQNLGGNITRVKKRIALLERSRKQSMCEDKVFPGGLVHENKEENRLQLVFDGKPSAEVRSLLKGWGFRWSHRNMAWQRQLTNAARYAADRFIERLGITEV